MLLEFDTLKGKITLTGDKSPEESSTGYVIILSEM
jgi:hypothetical protein